MNSIAIVGGGLGGAATAVLLQQAGYSVAVFEQTPRFDPAGAGIHLTPNVMRILAHIGIADALVASGRLPASFTSRDLASNSVRCALSLGERAEERYGAPYLTVGRGVLHRELINALRPGTVRYSKRLVGLDDRGGAVQLRFADGSTAEAPCVIGADGLGSQVREVMHGAERPSFSGQIAYRAVLPASGRVAVDRQCITKWWADDRFVIGYSTDSRTDDYYFVAGAPAEAWTHPQSWVDGDRDEMLDAFADSCEEVLGLLNASQSLTKWPLFERPPLQQWGRGRIALLGDACHPMRPHMAQGAAMAIEDGALLLRCLAAEDEIEEAFWRYAESRKQRTARVQAVSAENSWLKDAEDPSWVFSYDAMRIDPAPGRPRTLTVA
ncbi:6-hydroxynicotinate 3-monooxygenase [Streptacidiphilus pinicola]|uniref:6-hydroxynicotinate 3-monooxygenase n=1 Tax=Streptacidiphilus pinicola TaxID=2219663 RepID=A0A2X0J7U6_9ACTN|nr:FAD-dependent monooxygenase [Streptacidiphilus pinicola]RAG86336.1 6-hydroxynicotinate 3-monooxygenase [Streptacidiphilus pinicola]